jgi:cyclopropane fatty-acyl-phospholipid synthase-like methyltransferase
MNTNFDDKEYWNNFYAQLIENNVEMGPSPFAQFLMSSEFLSGNNDLMELGCGTGRDTQFFSRNGVNVIAVDQCSNTTNILDKLDNVKSFSADFTKLDSLSTPVDVVYSRFTMHSINEKDEDNTLKWAFDNLNDGGYFCIEARTIKDPIFAKGADKGGNVWFYNEHHRRFIVADEFKAKLESFGFKIVLFLEENGFAIHKGEDPIVLRTIVQKSKL